MKKKTLLAHLDRGGAEMEEALRDLSREVLTASGACGAWSLKDVLAHLSVSEDWTAEQLEGLARGDGPPSAEQMKKWAAEGLLDVESRNQVLYRASRFRPPDEVVGDVARTRRRLIAAVAALSEGRLDERHWFTATRTVAEAIEQIVEHAREHRVQALAELAAS